VVSIRGNVETRLAKLQAGAVDAIVLALAGLKRLGIADMATAVLEVEEFLPAAGQGIMAIETRADDTRVLPFVAALNDPPSASALSAERAFLAVLEGSCRTPIAAYAVLCAGRLYFRGLIAKPDGSEHFSIERDGSVADAVLIGTDAGRELRARAGTDFFRPA
jgi:hydroxymethylbilane synthase